MSMFLYRLRCRAGRCFTNEINTMRHVASAEAIVNIHNRYPGGTAIEHGQQWCQAMEVSPIPHTGGHRNDRFIDQAPHHAGECAFHASHNNEDPGSGQESILIEEAV